MPPSLRLIATAVLDHARVHLIDSGYPDRVVGVELQFSDPDDRPSDAVKAILKGGDDPLIYRKGAWVRRTGSDPVSDRMNAELRWADVVQVMCEERGR